MFFCLFYVIKNKMEIFVLIEHVLETSGKANIFMIWKMSMAIYSALLAVVSTVNLFKCFNHYPPFYCRLYLSYSASAISKNGNDHVRFQNGENIYGITRYINLSSFLKISFLLFLMSIHDIIHFIAEKKTSDYIECSTQYSIIYKIVRFCFVCVRCLKWFFL